jgi:hypothetical protein
MADVSFHLTTHVDYVASFADLKNKLGARTLGAVLEIEVLLPGGVLTMYMECRSLYLIGFKGRGGKVYALKDDEDKFEEYVRNKAGAANTVKSSVDAKYDVKTWNLKLIKSELPMARALNDYAEGSMPRDAAKAWVDRLAFAIAEAARFVPIRCAMACELCDDVRFKQVLQKLSEWSGSFMLDKRMVARPEPGKTLSPDDQVLRDRLGSDKSIQAVQLRQNPLLKLTDTEKWLVLLTGGDPANMSDADRKRLKSLTDSHYTYFTLANFKDLVNNWERLSAIDDPNLRGLLDACHLRHCASSTVIVPEWH